MNPHQTGGPTPFAGPLSGAEPPLRWRVLVVEDDAVDRLALRRHVTQHDLPYDLVATASVAEAHAAMAAGNFDAILVDHGLPDGNGFAVLGEAGDVPVIFVTGADDLALAVRAVRAGAADYLVKDTAREYLTMLPHTLARAVRERRTRVLLRQNQELCQKVFDEAPLGKILATPEGRVLRANRATTATLGYSLSELTAGGLELILAPEGLLEYRRGFARLLAGEGASFQFEQDCRHQAGEACRVQLHVSLIKDESDRSVIGVVQLQDVTAFRRIESALRASEAHLRQQFDAMPAAVFACDAHGYLTHFNTQTTVLWGRAPRLLDEADRYCRSLGIFEAGGACVPPERGWMAVALAERRLVRDDELVIDFGEGRRRHVLACSSPVFDPAGVLTGAINVLVDVTDLKRLEQRQRLLEQQLSQARKLEAVGTLAGGVAHEFNNLLTAILLNLQLIEADLPPDHALRPCLRDAVGTSRRARDLITRLLKFSEQAAGPQAPISLPAVVGEAIEVLRPALPDGITLVTRFDAGCPLVKASARELNEALLQLGLNAGQAMAGRGGRLEFAVAHGEPPAALREQHPQIGAHHTVQLAVRDTGPGMTAATVARLFEPFFTTKLPGQGTGLGLAGVYGIVRRHRGAVVVESAPGEGTTVRLFFPAASAAPPAGVAAGG
ncbi:MAG: PAS domain S-box protein [Verrucomicrobia bacterium]|nr:PAS domain S-box protein [Verrucomicrobiota bacterium]